MIRRITEKSMETFLFVKIKLLNNTKEKKL